MRLKLHACVDLAVFGQVTQVDSELAKKKDIKSNLECLFASSYISYTEFNFRKLANASACLKNQAASEFHVTKNDTCI